MAEYQVDARAPHPRTLEVQSARAALGSILVDLQERFKLTNAEVQMLLALELHNRACYDVRTEREGGAG